MKKFLITSLVVFAFISILLSSVEDSIAQDNGNSNTNSVDTNSTIATNQDAKYIYDTKSFTVDNNVKNFVVLIPNEAHESTNQDENQYPFLEQAYIPQDLTISAGTSVTWLNGDADHDHIIKFQPGNPQDLVETNQFAFPEYTTVVFNQTGSYPYYEDNVNENDESFVMEGTINVVDSNSESQTSSSTTSTTTPPTNTNSMQNGEGTIGLLMVPSQDFENIKTDLESSGINVLSDYSFTDLRGGQEGTGPTQSIVLWSSNNNNIEEAITPIVEITNELPYS